MPNDAPDWVSVQRAQLTGQAPIFTPLGDVTSPALTADSDVETISAGSAVSASGGVVASFKAAVGSVIAQVGALGARVVGTANSVTPTFGQATVAGHLLVAWVTSQGATTPATASPGWVFGWTTQPQGLPIHSIFYKLNCANGEADPTFTTTAGSAPMQAQLAEFSGAATASGLDQVNRITQATSATVLNLVNSAADAAFGDLFLVGAYWSLTTPATATWTEAANQGASAVRASDTGSQSITTHSVFSYAIIPAAAAAQPLGIANWDYDVIGNSGPAVGSQASVVLAAVAGKTYRLAMLTGSYVQTGATITNNAVNVLDGASTIFQHGLTVLGGNGNYNGLSLFDLALPGTPGNSMTVQFAAGGTTTGEKVNVGAYLR